jgi:hypothetical protein
MKRALFAVSIAVMLFSSSAFAQEQRCTVTSRAKEFRSDLLWVQTGEGGPGSRMTDIRMTLIENRYADCKIKTRLVLDYLTTVHFRATDDDREPHPASAYLHLSLMRNGQPILLDFAVLNVPMGHCETVRVHKELPINREDSLFDSTDGVRILPTPITGKGHEC